ncbi:GNAT family N-acetyltransferase [uncultured Aquincola sp.]|uniref:GNAT family N-acetyltransferase n=1 Tax=uncultured Aquincola sp. TaxID=886556 RepID=UPI0032B10D46
MTAPFRLEPLAPGHARASFACGVAALDHYLAAQAGQDVRRRVSACYVALESVSGAVAGYYTLAACGVALTDLPADWAKRLPRYPSVPVARVGRLAIDQRFQGRQLGSALLADAAVRAARSEVAVFALVVDAKDDRAARFYRHHGFEPFGAHGLQLAVPLKRFITSRTTS